MARIEIRTDDIDGSSIAEPVTFAFQGVGYSIDLSPDNLGLLTDVFAPYIAAGTRDAGSTTRRSRRRQRRTARPAPPTAPAATVPEVRAWAQIKGYPVGERGRIPAHVYAAFTETTGRAAPT